MDDYILRSEAIRVASGYCHWAKIPKELERLPAADVRLVEYAIDICNAVPRHCEFLCSRCKTEIGECGYGDFDGGGFRFCPGCGAKILYVKRCPTCNEYPIMEESEGEILIRCPNRCWNSATVKTKHDLRFVHERAADEWNRMVKNVRGNP